MKILTHKIKSTDDPFLVLMEYINTPIVGISTKPVEKMLGQATRSALRTDS